MAKPVFGGPLALALLLLAGCGALLITSLVQQDQSDLDDYERHVAPTDAKDKPPSKTPQGTQQRSLVVKDFFFAKGRTRLHAQLKSRRSHLLLLFTGSRVSLTEEMEGASGRIQEELYYRLPDGSEVACDAPAMALINPSWEPMQLIRSFTAKRASFSYHEMRLTAKEATLTRNSCAGHTLEILPATLPRSFVSKARSIECAFEGSHLPAFHATGLQAQLSLDEGWQP